MNHDRGAKNDSWYIYKTITYAAEKQERDGETHASIQGRPKKLAQVL